MPYKVFISTGDDEPSRASLTAVKEALYRFNEFPVAAISLGDIMEDNPIRRWESARRIIGDSQIFVGIFSSYGIIPPGQTQSLSELEYRYAVERGLACLIFVPEALRSGGEDRFQAFRDYLSAHHIIHYFKSAEELQAKVVLSISSYKKTQRKGEFSRLPLQSGAVEDKEATVEASVVQPDTLEQTINRVLSFAADDIEQIMRRALELHDAQKMVQSVPDGWLNINPVFGTPMNESQFQSDIFMITPFRPQFDSLYQTIIRPAVNSLNLTIKRGDDFASVTGVIINEIWAALNACRLVIAETTEVNANVYYELGIAHTLGKPAILLTQERDVEKLPFDIRHLRFIVYENSPSGSQQLAKDLRKSIVWILNDLEEIKKQ